MSFANYSGFRDELKSLMDWTDATTAQLDSIIRIAEPMINRQLRVKTMEQSLSSTVTTAGTVAVPADYLELKSAYIDGSAIKVLDRSTVAYIYRAFPNRSQQDASISRPKVARDGASFVFAPIQGQGDVMKGTYYAKPASSYMADSQTIHTTFSNYTEVYLFGAASLGEPYIGRDQRIQTWEAFFQKAINLANDEDRREAQSGGSLAAGVS